MKKVLIFLAALLGVFTIWFYWRNPLVTKVKLHDRIFIVDVAITPKEKERGLGYRDALAPDHGMLFVYDRKEQFQFWMKGMRFPLDIIWILDKTVISVDTDIQPPSTPTEQLKVYAPPVPVDKVLELPAGSVKATGIAVGDTMEVLR